MLVSRGKLMCHIGWHSMFSKCVLKSNVLRMYYTLSQVCVVGLGAILGARVGRWGWALRWALGARVGR